MRIKNLASGIAHIQLDVYTTKYTIKDHENGRIIKCEGMDGTKYHINVIKETK